MGNNANSCPFCRNYAKVVQEKNNVKLCIKRGEKPPCLLSRVIQKLKTIKPTKNIEKATKLLQNEADKFNKQKLGKEMKKKNFEEFKERRRQEIDLAMRNKIVVKSNIYSFRDLTKGFCWIIKFLHSLVSPWIIINDSYETFFFLIDPIKFIQIEDSSVAG